MRSARIVFDLDGTLIDSAPDIQAIANTLLKETHSEPISLAETRSFIGNGAAAFIEKVRAARGIPELAQAELLEAFTARHEGAVTLTKPYPKVEAALQRLAQDHRLGICTNKPLRPCLSVLKHLGLLQYFKTVIGGDSLDVRKPDPDPLRAAFDGLGIGPKLYVGDSEVDAETAVRTSVPFLLYTEGYRKSPIIELPHAAIFERFDDLPDLVAAQLHSRR